MSSVLEYIYLHVCVIFQRGFLIHSYLIEANGLYIGVHRAYIILGWLLRNIPATGGKHAQDLGTHGSVKISRQK